MDIKNHFSVEIEKMRALSPDVQFIELIVIYCEKHNIDLDMVPKLLEPTLKSKIRLEARANNSIVDPVVHHTMDAFL